MDDERQASIREALQTYRDRVKECNLSLLQAVIDRVATMQAHSNRPTSEQDTQERRVLAIAKKCFGAWDAAEFPSAPQDLLAIDHVRESLIIRYSLDGLHHDSIDAATRSAWFATLNNAIAVVSLEAGMPRPESLPASLKYLCTLVCGICGPGLPNWRFLHQVDFIARASQVAMEGEVKTAARVTKGMRNPEVFDFHSQITHDLMMHWGDDIAINWEDWEISLAVRIGDMETGNAGTYVVFCRRLKPADDLDDYYDEDEPIVKDEWKEGDDVWQWRYGTHDSDWESRLFDSVEDFLLWYAHCKDPSPDQYLITSLALPSEAKPWSAPSTRLLS